MKGKAFVNLMSFIAIAFIAVALLLSKILGAFEITSKIVPALELIAQIIAYTITAVYAFAFVKAKRSMGWMIAYVLCVIVIVVFLVLGNI